MSEPLPRCEHSDLPRLMCSCPDCDHFTMTEAEMRARRPESAPERPPGRRTQPSRLPEYTGWGYGRPAAVKPAQGGNPCRTCDALAGDAFLCPACLDDVERILGDVPAMVEDLEVAMQRRVRFTLNPGGASDDNPMPADLKAGRLLGQLRNELVGAVRILTEARALTIALDDTPEAMSRWLLRYSATIALDVAGPDICLGLRAVHSAVRQHIDRPKPKVYLGLCDQCKAGIYARQGDELGYCATTSCLHHLVPIVVRDALEQLDRRIHERLATVADLEFFAKRAGHKVTNRRIRYLIERGRLQRRGVSKTGEATYRIGDLLGQLEDSDGVGA